MKKYYPLTLAAMFNFFIAFNIFFMAQATQARSLKGKIIVSDNENIYLIRKNFKLKVTTKDPQIAQVFKKLKNNDYISVEGEVISTDLVVSSITFVGLKELLGLWQSQHGTCFYFTNYTQFKTFTPQLNSGCSLKMISTINQEETLLDYKYVITPSKDRWNIVISKEQDQYLAEYDNTNSMIKKLKIFDSETGEMTSTLVLRPITE